MTKVEIVWSGLSSPPQPIPPHQDADADGYSMIVCATPPHLVVGEGVAHVAQAEARLSHTPLTEQHYLEALP